MLALFQTLGIVLKQYIKGNPKRKKKTSKSSRNLLNDGDFEHININLHCWMSISKNLEITIKSFFFWVELQNYGSYDNDGNNGNNDLIMVMVWYKGIGGGGGGGSGNTMNDGGGGGDNIDRWGKWGAGGSSNRIDNDGGGIGNGNGSMNSSYGWNQNFKSRVPK